jgi:hypothetical protein
MKRRKAFFCFNSVRFFLSRLAERGGRKFRGVSDTEKYRRFGMTFDKRSLSLFSCIGRREILAERLQSRIDFFVLLYQDKRTKKITFYFFRRVGGQK